MIPFGGEDMLNEKKIKIMTKLAIFEESESKQDIKLSKYFKTDYMRLHLLKTIISVTIGYLLILAMVIVYNAEYLISHAVQLNYKTIGIEVLGIYIIILTCYILVSIIAYSIKYNSSRKNLSLYMKNLKLLQKFYHDEEIDQR